MIRLLPILLAACGYRPDVEVVATRDLGPLETTAAVKARDGGYSVGFRGRTAWLYGDTILSLAGVDGSSWRDNSWSWTPDLDASDDLAGFDEPVDGLGAPEEFFPETEAEAAYNSAHAGDPCAEAPCGAREVLWPMDAVLDRERDRVLAFYVKIHGEPGAWNFWSLGSGVAIWDDPDEAPDRPEARPGTTDPTLLFDAPHPFGTAALVHEGVLFAYACVASGDGWTTPCRLGRVDPAEVMDPEAWRYWGGSGWTADLAAAAAVLDGNAQLTVHWNPFLDRFLAVHVDWVTDDVVLRTAEAPEGPWSDPVLAFTALPAAGDGWIYCGLGHDELQREEGRFEYVSYYRSTGDWTGEVRLVEVEVDRRRR